jgi:hypothetical protein
MDYVTDVVDDTNMTKSDGCTFCSYDSNNGVEANMGEKMPQVQH